MGTDSSYTYDDEQFVMYVIVEPYGVHLKLYIYIIFYIICVIVYCYILLCIIHELFQLKNKMWFTSFQIASI